MSTIIQNIERSQLREGLPSFSPGDRVRVHFQVIEGTRRRTQVFEGVVIRRQGSGLRETFTVRKQSFGVGVERTFPVHSPKIEQLEIAARGDVRRAKLYYLRDRIGKAARVTERRWGTDEDLNGGAKAAAAAAAATSTEAAAAEAASEEAPEGVGETAAPEVTEVPVETEAAADVEPAADAEPAAEAESADEAGSSADAGEADESSD